jgi:hypothetical protein
MTHTTGTLSDATFFDGPDLPRGNCRRVVPGAVVIGFGTVAAAGVIAASFTIHPNIHAKAPIAPKIAVANPYGALAGPAYSFGSAPVLSDPGYAPDLALDAEPPPPPATAPVPAAVAPLPPKKQASELATSVPLPPPPPSPQRFDRPHIQAKYELGRPRAQHAARQDAAATAASAAPDNRNIFQKFFDMLQQPSGPVLAYARPEDGSISSVPAYNNSISLPAAESRTAVYDIEAHTVYMPNGDRLEAHSGLGNRLDDPNHVNEKGRGATPPHVYDLVLRGQLFHGVQALRLNPVGSGNMFGRTGILAHSYMLDRNGGSNGCVSFKDYPMFLQAFSRGEVKRLVVVAHLGATPSRAAPAPRGHDHRYAFNNQ